MEGDGHIDVGVAIRLVAAPREEGDGVGMGEFDPGEHIVGCYGPHPHVGGAEGAEPLLQRAQEGGGDPLAASAGVYPKDLDHAPPLAQGAEAEPDEGAARLGHQQQLGQAGGVVERQAPKPGLIEAHAEVASARQGRDLAEAFGREGGDRQVHGSLSRALTGAANPFGQLDDDEHQGAKQDRDAQL